MMLAHLTHVLHLEDEILIALDLQGALQDAGVRDVTHFSTCAQALNALDNVSADAAILDVDVFDGSTGPVATRLRELNIPFIIYTGSLEKVMPEHVGAPCLEKPVTNADIVAALQDLKVSAFS